MPEAVTPGSPLGGGACSHLTLKSMPTVAMKVPDRKAPSLNRMRKHPTHMSGYGCQLGTLGLLPLRHLSNRTAWASLHGGLGLHKDAWNSHLPNSVSQESHKANPGSRGEEMDSTH